jgi:hypothetical protein
MSLSCRLGFALMISANLVAGGAVSRAAAQEIDDLSKPLAPDCAGTEPEITVEPPQEIEIDQEFDITNPLLGFVPAPGISPEKTSGEICNAVDAPAEYEEPYVKPDAPTGPPAPCADPPFLKIEGGIRDNYWLPKEPANLTQDIRDAALPYDTRPFWTDFDQQESEEFFGHRLEPNFVGGTGYQYGSLVIRLRPIDGDYTVKPINDTISLWAPGAPAGWGGPLRYLIPIRKGREATMRLDLRTLRTGNSNLLADINQYGALNVLEQDDTAIDHMELTLSCTDPNRSSLVGIIPGSLGCGSLKTYEIYLDNEDKRNTNGRGGWIGGTVSTKNTLFKVCAVEGEAFTPAAEAGANFAVLSLGGTCPAGFTRFDRFHDNEDTRPASYDNLPGGSPTMTVQPQLNTNMAFCVASGTNTQVANSLFPSFDDMSYGVFGSRTPMAWALDRGWVHLDDEDRNNQNSTSGTIEPWQFLEGGENSTYFLARVK